MMIASSIGCGSVANRRAIRRRDLRLVRPLRSAIKETGSMPEQHRRRFAVRSAAPASTRTGRFSQRPANGSYSSNSPHTRFCPCMARRDQFGNWNILQIAKGCVGPDRTAPGFLRVRRPFRFCRHPLRDHFAEPCEHRVNVCFKGATLLAQPRHAVEDREGLPLAVGPRGQAFDRGRSRDQPPFNGSSDTRWHVPPPGSQAQEEISLVARTPKDRVIGVR